MCKCRLKLPTNVPTLRQRTAFFEKLEPWASKRLGTNLIDRDDELYEIT